MKNPLISIILPTHNGQRYVEKSIESCLNQTYQNIELIIVDDASTDDTPKIIREYATSDSRIRVLTNRANRKLPASLNMGHRASMGEFITWTSDDNFYHKDAIAEMVNFLLQNDGIMMTYCDYTIIDSQGNQIREVAVTSCENLSEYNCIGACFLYRRDVYEKIGFYNSKTMYAEDYDYWLRIASHYRILPLHENLYYYRFHGESLRSTIKYERIKLAAEIALVNSLPKIPWLTKEQKFKRITRIIRHSISHHDFWRLPSYLFYAFLYSPRSMMWWLAMRLKRVL